MLSSSGRCDVSPDLSGKLSLWPQKYNLLVLLCPHKSTTCYFVPLDLQTCKIPHLRYIVAHGGTRQPKEKKTTCPKRHGGGFFYVHNDFFMKSSVPFVLKKTRARYCTPIFGFPESPVYTGVSALSVCPFCVAGFCPFCVAGNFYRNPFVYRGFTCFYPQKKFALFVSLEIVDSSKGRIPFIYRMLRPFFCAVFGSRFVRKRI